MRPALLLFGFGLVLHTMFWLATGDRWHAHAAAFQGDAPVWQALADKAARGLPDELFLLPLRPPAMHWLVSALWDGGAATAWQLRAVFVVLGALLGPLVFLLTRHHLTERAAMLAGVLVAASTSLMVLGSGPHSELPYLVLVLVSLFDQERLRTAPSVAVALRFGLLHALLCLLRAEHALTFVAMLAVLPWQRAARWQSSVAIAAGTFALALVPWHVHAWRLVDEYNRAGAPALPPAGATAPGGLPWDQAALDRVAALPSFQHAPTYHFVTDTVRTRGGSRITLADLDVLSEAYGIWPEPLPRPFVCLYGGLNFFLANSREAAAGFSTAALDRAPPLLGGDDRYPPGLRNVLPKQGTLVLSYPPHLDHLVHGYRNGLAELLADPLAGVLRIAQKTWYAAEGAASGFGGYAAPIGLSGVRRPVDMVTATGFWANAYRGALLALAAAGLWKLRRQAWWLPWLAFAATKLVIIAAFFGYARQGALCTPVLMVAIAAVLSARMSRPHGIWILMASLLAIELVRTFTIDVTRELPDGRSAAHLAADDHRLVIVRYR